MDRPSKGTSSCIRQAKEHACLYRCHIEIQSHVPKRPPLKCCIPAPSTRIFMTVLHFPRPESTSSSMVSVKCPARSHTLIFCQFAARERHKVCCEWGSRLASQRVGPTHAALQMTAFVCLLLHRSRCLFANHAQTSTHFARAPFRYLLGVELKRSTWLFGSLSFLSLVSLSIQQVIEESPGRLFSALP